MIYSLKTILSVFLLLTWVVSGGEAEDSPDGTARSPSPPRTPFTVPNPRTGLLLEEACLKETIRLEQAFREDRVLFQKLFREREEELNAGMRYAHKYPELAVNFPESRDPEDSACESTILGGDLPSVSNVTDMSKFLHADQVDKKELPVDSPLPDRRRSLSLITRAGAERPLNAFESLRRVCSAPLLEFHYPARNLRNIE